MHVYSIVGRSLDRVSKRRGRFEQRFERRWRPTVSLALTPGITDLHLIYPNEDRGLAEEVGADARVLNPSLRVHFDQVDFDNPFEIVSTYLNLLDYVDAHREEMENGPPPLFHVATGTHIQKIVVYILIESRLVPGMLVQAAPGEDRSAEGQINIIDLDLSKYAPIVERHRQRKLSTIEGLKRGIATRSPAFNGLIEELEVVASRSKSPILLMGPTGAGKSDLARRIFSVKQHAGLVTGKLVEVNCATLRGDNAMSALFGHRRGAFTGAHHDRDGLLKQAHQGVLMLDEIGELQAEEQAMLLTAIEEKRFYPLGSDVAVESDFQLIAGTNRDLRQHAKAGQFREDLLARIDLWPFRLPSLRERPEDIEPNIDYELERISLSMGRRVRFQREARERYLGFALSPEAVWTGNFRDLIASLTRMVTLASSGSIPLCVVDREIDRLKTNWTGTELTLTGHVAEPAGPDLGDDLDPIDRHTLLYVYQVCRSSKTVAEASRRLFSQSLDKNKTNATHRLKSYLQRFGIEAKDWVGGRPIQP